MKFYPIMVKQMTDEETKEYHRKRRERLCLESIAKDTFYSRPGYYFTPDFEEEQFTKREKRWNRWYE